MWFAFSHVSQLWRRPFFTETIGFLINLLQLTDTSVSERKKIVIWSKQTNIKDVTHTLHKPTFRNIENKLWSELCSLIICEWMCLLVLLPQPRKASATCSSATAAASSGLEEWNARSPRQRSSAPSPEIPDPLHSDTPAKPPSPAGAALALSKPPSPCAPGLLSVSLKPV